MCCAIVLHSWNWEAVLVVDICKEDETLTEAPPQALCRMSSQPPLTLECLNHFMLRRLQSPILDQPAQQCQAEAVQVLRHAMISGPDSHNALKRNEEDEAHVPAQVCNVSCEQPVEPLAVVLCVLVLAKGTGLRPDAYEPAQGNSHPGYAHMSLSPRMYRQYLNSSRGPDGHISAVIASHCSI